MSILVQIQNTIKYLQQDDIEQALKEISIAISATAENEYSDMSGDGNKYKHFLKGNLPLITKVAYGSSIGNIIVENKFKEVKGIPERIREKDSLSLDEIMYHVVRCGILHTAELPKSISFQNRSDVFIDFRESIKIIFSKDIVIGLLLSVIVAKTNQNNKFDQDIILNIRGKNIFLNKIWGNRDLVMDILKEDL